ncbi:hypothetical protein Tco_1032400 [Tanacetum coccineum]|uniref:Uncharacterized protein n=1 Tax=Tanacetum coccineum TaxID=301880 RepID=A0ABQ5GDE1_9ASTR
MFTSAPHLQYNPAPSQSFLMVIKSFIVPTISSPSLAYSLKDMSCNAVGYLCFLAFACDVEMDCNAVGNERPCLIVPFLQIPISFPNPIDGWIIVEKVVLNNGEGGDERGKVVVKAGKGNGESGEMLWRRREEKRERMREEK